MGSGNHPTVTEQTLTVIRYWVAFPEPFPEPEPQIGDL
jgi:hypothetical protein